MNDTHEQVPNILTGVTAFLAGITLVSAVQIVQIISGCAAVVTAFFAIRYYIARTKALHRED